MFDFIKNKIRFLFGILLICFGWMACSKQDLPVKPEPSAFAASMENGVTSFGASGGTGNIIVSGGTNGWWVTVPSNNWLVITKTYGSGDFKLPVTVRPNTTGSPREITVTIHPTFGLPPVSIKLTQSN